MKLPTNLLDGLPKEMSGEIYEALLDRPGLRVERIVSMGHRSPEGSWYDQEMNECVLVVQGAARLRFEGGEPMELSVGSFINIPAHTRHRVEWTDPGVHTVWLAVHYS